jgi:voltage-gated potassium channel
MELRRRLAFAFLLMLGLVAISVCGYIWLGSGVSFLDALYMAVITISTIGYTEVVDTSHNPLLRVFNMGVILLGWGLSAYVLASVTTFLVEGEITNIFWRRKMQKKISELKDHYIVCALGDTGRHAVEELQKTGTPYVVVESHEDNVKKVREDSSGQFNEMLYLIGDATDDQVLEDAGIARAKGLITALSVDKDNLVITVMVRQKSPNIRIVARCTDPKYADKLVKAGANATVSPNMIGGLRMASEMLRPHVVGFLDMMLKQKGHALRIEEIEVEALSTWVGKTLGELNLREHFNILPMAIKGKDQESMVMNPPDRTTMSAGAILIVMGDMEDIRRARHEAQHHGVHIPSPHLPGPHKPAP